ncbi:MAG: ABC transporter substrate-binding protein [Mycobacterium sp.]
MTGCGRADSDAVVVNVGYQSKTINTVNAGTLMRDRGELEKALEQASRTTGKHYRVVWQDFASGAPLTAQMIASHVDIGSMGDYPLLTNGSKTSAIADAKTELVAVTGYNLRGSLNQVVVPPDSPAATLADLRGKKVSTSLGSAADGMLTVGLQKTGMSAEDLGVVNQDPSIGAAALQGKQVDAFAQFVPWPQLAIFRKEGRLLYDGGDNGIPTFHGVVVRTRFADANPDVMSAFMDAMAATTKFIQTKPLEAAQRVSAVTGIEPEVIYLYNGPNGLVTFDMSIKDQLIAALEKNKPFLVQHGAVAENFSVKDFVNNKYVQTEFGDMYPGQRAQTTNPATLAGNDDVCGIPVNDPTKASETWFEGESSTKVSATPSCLLRALAGSPAHPRAAYVPDAATGTRIFADHATWLTDAAVDSTDRFKPFATTAGADAYRAQHPEAQPISYEAALQQSRTAT